MAIENLPKNSAVIFREYDLPAQEREKLAQEIIAICRKNNHKILIGKNFELARKLKADGVHFSDNDRLSLQILNRRNLPQKFILSVACHNFLSVLKFRKLKVDAVFISPIFATKSHPEAKLIGLQALSRIILKAKHPIYALGGINSQNINSLQKLGAKGIGGIELFNKI